MALGLELNLRTDLIHVNGLDYTGKVMHFDQCIKMSSKSIIIDANCQARWCRNNVSSEFGFEATPTSVDEQQDSM